MGNSSTNIYISHFTSCNSCLIVIFVRWAMLRSSLGVGNPFGSCYNALNPTPGATTGGTLRSSDCHAGAAGAEKSEIFLLSAEPTLWLHSNHSYPRSHHRRKPPHPAGSRRSVYRLLSATHWLRNALPHCRTSLHPTVIEKGARYQHPNLPRRQEHKQIFPLLAGN